MHIEVQWAGKYHQLGHNEHRVPCLWPLDRCRPPGKIHESSRVYTPGKGLSRVYTPSRGNSHKIIINGKKYGAVPEARSKCRGAHVPAGMSGGGMSKS